MKNHIKGISFLSQNNYKTYLFKEQKMRLHYILASLTIATEFALANNDFLSVNDIEDEILEE